LYKKGKELASSEIFKSNFAKPIVDDKFLKFIEEETYQFIGDWEYNVTKNARLAIIQAIKDGKSIADVVNILEAGIKEKSNASLDRYARTKFTEVMNKGRLAFFEDTGVVSGYQYSAILDDRTTEICRGLHGKIFKAGNQPIPPMHFNCRSMLIPITVYEPFDPDTKVGKTPIEDFIEEKKGEGFPKQ
jgi:SPP1 gp7 family putative phage head morphogenesis protein